MAGKKRDDRGENENCFAEARERITAVSEEQTTGLNLDLEDVVMAGLVLVDRVRKDDRAAFLAKLAPTFIEANLIEKLETTCLAGQYIVDIAATEGATDETFKVDAVLVEQATAVKKRMLKTIEYNLEHIDSVRRRWTISSSVPGTWTSRRTSPAAPTCTRATVRRPPRTR